MDIEEIVKSRAKRLGYDVFLAPSIPEKKLQNAVADIAKGLVKPEDVIAVWDNTMFGACDVGLLFAKDSFHYRAMFKAPIHIRYEDVGVALVEGVFQKDLIVASREYRQLCKIENIKFDGDVAADILNGIAMARDTEEAAAEANDTSRADEIRTLKEQIKSLEKRRSFSRWILCVGLLIVWGSAFCLFRSGVWSAKMAWRVSCIIMMVIAGLCMFVFDDGNSDESSGDAGKLKVLKRRLKELEKIDGVNNVASGGEGE